jgi:hypothetical protein
MVERTVWGDDTGVTWENAPEHIKESFALVRLWWFYRMVASGGPDGSEMDAEVADEAREAAEWFGPIIQRRAGMGDPDPSFVEERHA